MKVVELFSGLGGWGSAFKERGHQVFSIDNQNKFKPSLCKNILDVSAAEIPFAPDVVLASPPCEAFSIMANGNWQGTDPISIKAKLGVKILQKTITLIHSLNPKYFIIENPRGKMRYMLEIQSLERRTITYCQYGMPYQKPTDLWGGFPPSLVLRPACFKGAKCHEYVSQGMQTGIKGCTSVEQRSLVPYELSLEVCLSLENDLCQTSN